MNPKNIYSTKAEKYARYRWDYAPQAVEVVFDIAGLTPASVVADIGAGSGILTRQLIGRARNIIAFEPGAEMCRLLWSSCFSCLVAAAFAEALPLVDRSVDMITVAQAIAAMPAEDHPFYPRLEAAAREVFQHDCTAGMLTVHGETELIIGKIDG